MEREVKLLTWDTMRPQDFRKATIQEILMDLFNKHPNVLFKQNTLRKLLYKERIHPQSINSALRALAQKKKVIHWRKAWLLHCESNISKIADYERLKVEK